MSLLRSAEFATTVAQRSQLPAGVVPEVAFVGRSNAGKSSAINALCGRRRLAYASRTPGRTQALNLFSIHDRGRGLAALIVDTPGYGFAAVPLAEKRKWDALAGSYLHEREQLAGVVLVCDIRRGLTDGDRRLLGWVPEHVPVLVLATKSDKLAFAQRQRALQSMQTALHRTRPEARLLAFSVPARVGLELASATIEGWIADRAPARAEPAEPNEADHPAGRAVRPSPGAGRSRKPGRELPRGRKKKSPAGNPPGSNAYTDKAPAQGGEAGGNR